MSSAVEASPGRIVVESPAGRAWRRDRRFFTGMALAAALVVFVGFAPTYYLKGAFAAPALRPLLHLHGALFTSWIVLFLVQTVLVAARRVDVHRRLGVAGGALAVAMFGVGLAAAVGSARRGFTPPGGPPALVFFAIPFFDMFVFASLIGTGLYLRRRSEAHKRLMLLATIGLLPAALARLPHIGAAGPPGFFGATDLFVIACIVYDRVTRGRVHPAFLWGGLGLIASQVLRLVIGGTPAWQAFASWLTR
jgi:hypothetical protein